MTRAEAISHARVGAQKLWAGTVVVHLMQRPARITTASWKPCSIFQRARPHALGRRLEFVDEAGPGDFIFVPPYVPHQELNARSDMPVEAVVVRSGQKPIVVNLDIPTPEPKPKTPQPDPFHSAPGKS